MCLALASAAEPRTPEMSGLLRGVLGVAGTVMLLHAGYSASESLAYEKSVDPSSPLQVPLDVMREMTMKLIVI